MIDGLLRERFEPLVERMASPLVHLGLTPNQVTATGMASIATVCALYLWHQSSLIFGLCLGFAFAFDALDGAVARRRNMRTKTGGYFDAMVDRYQEFVVLAAIAMVADQWPLAMAAFAGGMLTSYAKARAALEAPISNRNWPDLFERLERILLICALLVLHGILQWLGMAADWVLTGGLAVYAALTHLSAAQRIARAVGLLRMADHDGL